MGRAAACARPTRRPRRASGQERRRMEAGGGTAREGSRSLGQPRNGRHDRSAATALTAVTGKGRHSMSGSPETHSPAGQSRGRVLVVDDEEALLRLIGRMLTTAGYEVSTASDGGRAAELLTGMTFDAILSDIDMPKMNGIQLLQTVRQRDLAAPVVLMTGNPDVKTAVQAVAHGALQYLIKPVNMEALGAAVARAVRLNKMAKLKRDALALVSEGGLGVGDRLALEASFERALDTLWIAYQPIVRVVDRSLCGYERLLRSEEKALPHPGAILDAAERLGRLDDLGRKIRAAACTPVPAAPPEAVFFINLHARDLMDADLLSGKSPLSAIANRVVLEITERASLDEVKDVRGTIAALRKMGFRIAIDDLGAGYA